MIDKAFLKASREWLLDPTFRELIMAQPVDKAAQEAWFASLAERSDYLIWGLKTSEWIGACGIKNIDFDNRSAEYWGYIYPAHLRGAGIGWQVLHFIVSKARSFGIDKLWLRVSKNNQSAILTYERWGFSRVCSEGHDIIRMELFL
ncbi:GNAT family N-acetyltransferase [Thioclava sp. ES.031]|uniref:GNAT family N-acetyltransferase n=1 Tax=Thioclava sp. ES.031 TaxID=1798203 RepID=UPI000BF322CB|nr:GNAT family N-acetyltransferase [Thioclava sp. ES.031]